MAYKVIKNFLGNNGYRRVTFKDLVTGREVFCQGLYIPCGKFMYDLFGEQDGDELLLSDYKEVVPTSKTEYIAVLEELTNAIVAKEVFNKHGLKAIKVLENNTSLLSSYGDEVKKEFERKRFFEPLAFTLATSFISQDVAERVYKDKIRLGDIKANPYLLCKYGVSLTVVSRIARNFGVTNALMEEVLEVVDTIKKHETLTGDSAMPKELLAKKAESIKKAEKDGFIVSSKDYYYRKEVFDCENEAARKTALLLSDKIKPIKGLDKKIDSICQKMDTTLSEGQKEAVKMAVSNKMCIITGGAGTGKTTVVKVVCEMLKKVYAKECSFKFLAPTGRASSRLAESTGYDATTIHKALNISEATLMESLTPLIEEKVTICDEASMLDIFVFRKLVSSIKKGNHLILLGDPNQLPSISAGRVLADLLESSCVPSIRLTKTFRQGSGFSNILANANGVIRGKKQFEEASDFVVVETSDDKEASRLIAECYEKEVSMYGIENVCCLSPFRKKGASGVDALNSMLQARINPKTSTTKEVKSFGKVFREGDIVMNTKNFPDACNGEIGRITKISRSQIVVKFPQGEKIYKDTKNLDLAYAMSIHKSQGSEFKSVICTILPMHEKMLGNNLLYTAITRAKYKFTLVGSAKSSYKAIDNREANERFSKLGVKIDYIASRL